MHLPLLFDISGGEFIVVLLFVLLFFGSKGIPDFARGLGRTMRQVRDASNEVQREIQREANSMNRALQDQRNDRTPSRPPDATTKEGPDTPPQP
ncbi:MAG: twin-arginine translocase TatA/TatE family subunit [Flavobacteriales bacterium]|jgi:TatA/E family protein of Tat protein translocase|nr:twin-arginine translocase TatA/TatE family subunit [Flavobacteriales bacterium]